MLVDYVVAIEHWDWSYSVSLSKGKYPVDPYHEFRHMQITGNCCGRPTLKADRVELSLLPCIAKELPGFNPWPEVRTRQLRNHALCEV
jgi:hypothetical protein